MRVSPFSKLVSAFKAPAEYWDVLCAVRRLAGHHDPVFREFALRRASYVAQELHRLATGEIVFSGTDTWRAAYEQILTSLNVSRYRSVSWVMNDRYWHDLPGRQSMRLNYRLLDKGLQIERVLILGPELWPRRDELPQPRIRNWIEEQHYRGVAVSLVKASDLDYEPDLHRDFGIYGERATGEQELDDESRTVRFVLRFDETALRLANDRWERLQLFTLPYSELLDRAHAA